MKSIMYWFVVLFTIVCGGFIGAVFIRSFFRNMRKKQITNTINAIKEISDNISTKAELSERARIYYDAISKTGEANDVKVNRDTKNMTFTSDRTLDDKTVDGGPQVSDKDKFVMKILAGMIDVDQSSDKENARKLKQALYDHDVKTIIEEFEKMAERKGAGPPPNDDFITKLKRKLVKFENI